MTDKQLKKGLKDPDPDHPRATSPGTDSLPALDTAAEVNERDYKEGQLRKAGQRTQRE